MSALLLIDFNNTVIRSLSVNKYLSYDGMYTGGIYGMLMQLTSILNKHHIDAVLNCTDAKPYLREKLYPGFKGDRKKKTYNEEDDFDFYEALTQSTSATMDFFKLLGIPTWKIPGLEADDLIAKAANHYISDFDKIIILSNDTDLNQMLRHSTVYIYKKRKGARSPELYGEKEFKEDFDIEPEQWVWYTAMVGTHNGVPGIKGTGPKTAHKLLHDEEKWTEYAAYHEDALSEKAALIQLPFPEYEGNMRVMSPGIINSNTRTIALFLSQYGIEFTGYMRDAFEG